MKTCVCCKELKAVDQFREDPRAKDGKRSTCKACQKKQSTESWRRRLGKGVGKGRSKRDVEREAPQAPSEVKCPACNGTKFVKLAASDTTQRLQCADKDCGEHTTCPLTMAAGLDYVDADAPARTASKASADLTCPKCSRPFSRGGFYRENHVAKCDGTPWKAPAASPKPERLEGGTENEADEPAAPVEGRGSSLKQRVLRFIRQERDYHNDQADVARRMFDVIAEVKDGGE